MKRDVKKKETRSKSDTKTMPNSISLEEAMEAAVSKIVTLSAQSGTELFKKKRDIWWMAPDSENPNVSHTSQDSIESPSLDLLEKYIKDFEGIDEVKCLYSHTKKLSEKYGKFTSLLYDKKTLQDECGRKLLATVTRCSSSCFATSFLSPTRNPSSRNQSRIERRTFSAKQDSSSISLVLRLLQPSVLVV